jgi:hypothetical protein
MAFRIPHPVSATSNTTFFTSRLYGGGKSPNCQLPSLGHCVSGVHAQVQDDLTEGPLFSKDRLRFTFETKLNLNMFANQPSDHLNYVFDFHIEV